MQLGLAMKETYECQVKSVYNNVQRVRNHLSLLFFSLSFLDSNDDIEANLNSDVELEDKHRQKSGKSNVCTCTVSLLEENQFMAVGILSH